MDLHRWFLDNIDVTVVSQLLLPMYKCSTAQNQPSVPEPQCTLRWLSCSMWQTLTTFPTKDNFFPIPVIQAMPFLLEGCLPDQHSVEHSHITNE